MTKGATHEYADDVCAGRRKDNGGRKMKKKNSFRFGQMAFGCVIIAFVSVFACIMASSIFAPPLKGYATVPCRIVKSSVKMEKVNRFVFTAEFSYERLGKTCISDSLRRPGQCEFVFDRLASRMPLLEKYAPGTEHECKVNPGNPWDAVLAVENPVDEPYSLSGHAGLIVGGMVLLLFFSAGAFMIASAFPSVRRLGTPRVQKFLTAVALVSFGCPFMTIGSMVAAQEVRGRIEAKASVPVPAKVLYSGIYSHLSGGRHPRTSYGVRVGYEYTVDGKKYENDRLAISTISSNNYDHHRYVAGKYKKGEAVTAFVSPGDPRKSLLEKPGGIGSIGGAAFAGMFGVFGFALICGGAWMMFSLLCRGNGAPVAFAGKVLKRSAGELAAVGLFAAVWNVFSWVFLLGYVGAEQIRNPSPVLLALAVFPLAGIFLVGVFIRKLVNALRAPRLELALTCSAWKHGAPAQIHWRLERPEEIASFEIVLALTRMEGSGKCRYPVTVSSQDCCRYARPPVPGAGCFGFTVPEEAGDGCALAFAASIKSKSAKRAFTLSYPLPRPDKTKPGNHCKTGGNRI